MAVCFVPKQAICCCCPRRSVSCSCSFPHFQGKDRVYREVIIPSGNNSKIIIIIIAKGPPPPTQTRGGDVPDRKPTFAKLKPQETWSRAGWGCVQNTSCCGFIRSPAPAGRETSLPAVLSLLVCLSLQLLGLFLRACLLPLDWRQVSLFSSEFPCMGRDLGNLLLQLH